MSVLAENSAADSFRAFNCLALSLKCLEVEAFGLWAWAVLLSPLALSPFLALWPFLAQPLVFGLLEPEELELLELELELEVELELELELELESALDLFRSLRLSALSLFFALSLSCSC